MPLNDGAWMETDGGEAREGARRVDESGVAVAHPSASVHPLLSHTHNNVEEIQDASTNPQGDR